MSGVHSGNSLADSAERRRARINLTFPQGARHAKGMRNSSRLPADLSRFFVITPIINSPRYSARAENYDKFKQMCEAAGVKLVTVEAAFGARGYEVTERDNPYHVQVRTQEEFWAKENLINIAIAHILQMWPDAREIAWVDSDCFPMSPPREWFEETWHALQHHEFVQMWEYLLNFGPDYQPISGPQMSFMKTYAANGFTVPEGKNVKHTLAGNSGMVALGRPGLAWAANVSALNAVGRLIDFCILGSADWHMAHALVGAMLQHSSEFVRLSKYAQKLLHWQERAEYYIKRDVGFVPVTVGHWYHGSKQDRKYGSRGQILINAGYDPDIDIKYDSYGMIQLETITPRQITLRDGIRNYLATRNEDSVPLR